MEFRLLVEGDTEALVLPDFLQRWLNPRLTQRIGIKTTNLNGCAKAIRDIPTQVTLNLSGPDRAKIIAVIGLLDLYGLPSNFQRLNLQWENLTTQQRYDWAKSEIEGRVNEPKFRQFFAVHELEAWLLSDLENNFPDGVKEALRKHSQIEQPEKVNLDKPPAKLLDEFYLQKVRRKYGKKVDGKKLFDKLDPQKAYDKCPNFKVMLDEMLELAHAAGL